MYIFLWVRLLDEEGVFKKKRERIEHEVFNCTFASRMKWKLMRVFALKWSTQASKCRKTPSHSQRWKSVESGVALARSWRFLLKAWCYLSVKRCYRIPLAPVVPISHPNITQFSIGMYSYIIATLNSTLFICESARNPIRWSYLEKRLVE